MKRLVSLSGLVAIISFALAGSNGGAQQPAGPDRDFVADEMLVQYAPGTSALGKAVARGRVGASAIETVARGNSGGDLELVRIPPGLAVSEAARGIQGSGVEFAEPNWIYTTGLVSNDTYYTNGSLWGMYGAATSPANQYGSGAAAAWAANHVGTSNVYVGIIDEGVMPHADFGANVWTNPGEIRGHGIDGD